jgi:hypothetical protein
LIKREAVEEAKSGGNHSQKSRLIVAKRQEELHFREKRTKAARKVVRSKYRLIATLDNWSRELTEQPVNV